MTIGEMRQAKQEKGYSMAQLSALSGVPLGTLQKIFNGETEHPRYKTRQAIERALGGIEAGEDRRITVAGGQSPASYQYEPRQPGILREPALAYGIRQVKEQGEYTVEDYYAWPKEQRIELIDGVIYEMEAPGFVHQRIAAVLLYKISAYIREKGGSCIPLASPLNVRLDCDDKTMVQPDLVILCDKDKMKRWGVMGAPDFVLEVISESTRKKDYTKKLQKYADAGVKEYWIVDPEKRMLITYNFINWDIPGIQPLEGTADVALYGGELKIDLDEIAGLIEELPE